ncbi:MAG TPA: hypothetical protein DCO79_05345 [Spirochaeta sp.]|nr:hypothetical protein [Spirochaeta sp.]
MKKKLTIILSSAVLLFLLTACPSPPAIMGTEPLLLGGHFLFEQVYNDGRNIYTYNPDGTYEHIGKEWDETEEAWVQAYGSRGTYEYDNSNYMMILTSTERWGWGEEDAWNTVADNYTDAEGLDSYSVTEYETTYFTTNGKYTAYLAQSDGSWKSESGYSHKESWDGDAQEYYNKSVRTWEIGSSEIMYTQNNFDKEWEETDTRDTYLTERGGTVRQTAPSGDEWKVGKTVTFYYGNDVNKTRRWDWELDEWQDWEYNENGDTWTRTFVHLGDLILEVDVDSSKNLIVR